MLPSIESVYSMYLGPLESFGLSMLRHIEHVRYLHVQQRIEQQSLPPEALWGTTIRPTNLRTLWTSPLVSHAHSRKVLMLAARIDFSAVLAFSSSIATSHTFLVRISPCSRYFMDQHQFPGYLSTIILAVDVARLWVTNPTSTSCPPDCCRISPREEWSYEG